MISPSSSRQKHMLKLSGVPPQRKPGWTGILCWEICAAVRLLRGGFLAEAAHPLLKFLAQRRGCLRIESHQIPERL